MPVVQNGLEVYINAKDGIKSPRKFVNLAPSGRLVDAVITGGTYNAADGSLTLDGVDDYIEVMMDAGGAVMQTIGSWTYEYIFHLVTFPNDNAYHELSGNGHYNDLDPNLGTGGGVYMDFYAGGTNNTYTSVIYANYAKLERKHFQWRYNSSTNVVSFFINGVLIENKTFASTPKLALAKNSNSIAYNRAYDSTSPQIKFHAMRYYSRPLTDAEITQNYQNGIEIGFSTPEVRIAVERISNGNGTFTDLPIFDITGHETEKARVFTPEGKGYFGIVPITDPNASRIRIRTEDGTFALRKL